MVSGAADAGLDGCDQAIQLAGRGFHTAYPLARIGLKQRCETVMDVFTMVTVFSLLVLNTGAWTLN